MRKKISLFFLIIILSSLFSCSNKNTENTTSPNVVNEATELGNIHNRGYAIMDENTNIYFISPSNDFMNELCGPQKTIDGREVHLGQNDILALFLKRQDQVYFLKRDCQVYRFNVETKETELVFDALVNQMIEVDGGFYCITSPPESELWKLSIDESGDWKYDLLVESEVRHLAIDEHKIYYTANQTLYCDPDDPHFIASNINEEWLYVVQGMPYYVSRDDKNLYKINGGSITQVDLSGLKIYYLNIAEDKLIMVAMDNHMVLRTYLFDPATEKTDLFSPHGYGEIFIAGRDVYERLWTDTGIEIRFIGKLKI